MLSQAGLSLSISYFTGQVIKKISIVSWAYTIGSYVDEPVEPAHEKATVIMNTAEPERS